MFWVTSNKTLRVNQYISREEVLKGTVFITDFYLLQLLTNGINSFRKLRVLGSGKVHAETGCPHAINASDEGIQ